VDIPPIPVHIPQGVEGFMDEQLQAIFTQKTSLLIDQTCTKAFWILPL
jgi:hypothetical protein